jgi:integrase
VPLNLVPPGKRKGNRFYLLRGTLGGRSFEVSTKTADIKAAREFKKQFERRAGESSAPRPGEQVTLARAIDLYSQWRDPNKADERRLDRLRRAIGTKFLGDITHATLVEAANLLHPAGSAATRNREVLRPAAAVLHYASANALCDWLRVKLFKEKRPETRAVSTDVASLLIKNAPGDDERLLLLWLFRQGDRITDALSVEWKRVDLVRRTVTQRIGKTDEWRTAPLADDLWEALANVPEEKRGRYVFRWRTRFGVYKWSRPLCRRLGVKFTPHMARHSMATWFVDEGVDLRTIMEAGGWRDIKSVARYANAGIERVRAVRDRGEKLGKKAESQ